MNPLVVKRKLERMLQYLGELDTMSGISLDEYLSEVRERRAVERLIQLIVDVAVDINTHMVVDAGHPAPNDSRSSFLGVERLGVLPSQVVKDIAPSVGERNIIVHQYDDLDDEIIHASIGQTLRLYREYVRYVLQYLEKAQP